MTPRIAYHADESFQETGGSFLLIRVTEGVAGYEPVETFPTLELAVAAANRTNVGLSLSPKDVFDIRLSSMTESMLERGEALPAKQQQYHVGWAIDIEATGPVEAARRAFDSFCRPGSIAHVFEVALVDDDIEPDDEGVESLKITATWVVDLDRGLDSNHDGEPIQYPLTEEG
jgi:hypothetical protein